jgi:hypothetical protein
VYVKGGFEDSPSGLFNGQMLAKPNYLPKVAFHFCSKNLLPSDSCNSMFFASECWLKADFRKIYYSGCEMSRETERKRTCTSTSALPVTGLASSLFMRSHQAIGRCLTSGFLRLTAEFRRAVKFYSISAERDGVQQAAFANSAPLRLIKVCALSLISRKH